MDLVCPCVFLQDSGRPRMLLHPGKHLIIGAAGDNHLAQRLGIQPGKGEESSVQRGLGSQYICEIGFRELPFGKEADFVDQPRKQDISTKRLPGRSKRHRFLNIHDSPECPTISYTLTQMIREIRNTMSHKTGVYCTLLGIGSARSETISALSIFAGILSFGPRMYIDPFGSI
jgi:hypothetical protein